MPRHRVTVDTGGTYSDYVYLNEEPGEVSISKLPSTPDDPSRAILQGIETLIGKGARLEDISYFCHGTTVGTNALLEGKGARTALLVTEGFRGIYPVGGATLRFPFEAGWGNAMRYLLTGDEFGASEAHRMGLVQEVTAPGEEFAVGLGIAERIARQAPLGVRATLASARLALAEGEAEAARRLLPDLKPLMRSDDVKEGVASFLERREANFAGR